MSNSSDEKVAAALMGELLLQLGRREDIRKMLGNMGTHDPGALVARLVDEFERIVSRHYHEMPPREEPLPVPQPPKQVELQKGKPVIDEAPELLAGGKETTPTGKTKLLRVPYEPEDGSLIYLHGVSHVGENASATPFMLEEKGIDGRSFAFAMDYGDLRFYLSPVNSESMNLSTTGVLLMSKQESIRLRGLHESILNDLRLHGILLPFEFGTVARSKEDFFGIVDPHLKEIQDALDELLGTHWWNVSVSALDSRIAQLVTTDTTNSRREIDRGRVSYSTPTQPRRLDVKTLERILAKQKKIAETVHSSLQPFAERSDIDMMVSLQSGSSDDWKLILKSSYELNPSVVMRFIRTVTELQYQHFLMELMISLTGDYEVFVLRKPQQ